MVRQEEVELELRPNGLPRTLESVYGEMQKDWELADYTELLGNFQTVLEGEHASYFDNEAGPEGAWKPLAQSTVNAKGHDKRLFEGGDLRDSLISPGGDAIRDVFNTGTVQGMVFGTSDHKSIFHQNGTKTIPKRVHVGMTEPVLDEFVDELANQAVEQLKGA